MGYFDKETFTHSNKHGEWVICRMTDLLPHANRIHSGFDAGSYRFVVYKKADYDAGVAGQPISQNAGRYLTCVFSGFLVEFNPSIATESLNIAHEAVLASLNNLWFEEELWFTTDVVGNSSSSDIISGLHNGSFTPIRKNP